MGVKFGAYTALVIAYLIWGANFVVAKIVLQEIPPMSLSFIRFSLASILLIPFLLTSKKKLFVELKDLPKLFLAGVLMITFHIALFYEGLSRTTAIDASVLSLITPICSVAVGWIFLKEKIYWINLVGTVLSLFGGFFILGLTGIFTSSFSTTHLVGNFLLILSVLVFIIGSVFSKPLLKKYHYVTFTTVTFLVGVLTFSLPATYDYLKNPDWINKITVFGILGVLFITVLSTISAFFLYQWAFEKVGLSKASLFSYLNPAISASLAVPLLGERVSFSFILGTCMIILGVYWGTLGKEHHLYHLKHH